MADIRINALATTATTPASDDYLALDGTAQGTRKILATNIANNVTDVILGSSGPSVKSTLSARAPRQGLVFDGTAESTATITSALGSTDKSFSFVVQINENRNGILHIGTANLTVARQIQITLLTTRKLRVELLGATTGDIRQANTDNAIADNGKFAHVVCTISGATLTIYVNGVSVAYTQVTAGTPPAWSDAVNGTAVEIGGTVGTEFASTVIQQPLIYNRALSASEVVALYEAGAPAGADYNSASNTAVYSTDFSSSSGWTAESGWSFSGTAAVASGTSVGAIFRVVTALVPKARYRFTYTVTSYTSGSVNVWLQIGGTRVAGTNRTANGTYTEEIVAPSATGTSYVGVQAATAASCSFSVDDFSYYNTGLLLAPDAAQAGGGLTWYDTSGNAANITLPASGVSWNVPSSQKTASGWTYGGNLTVSSSSAYLKLASTGSSNTWDLFSDSNGSFYLSQSGVVNALRVFPTTGNVSIGAASTDNGNGKLQLATHTTSAGGIGFGTDTSLYRQAAQSLNLDGASSPQFSLSVSGTQKARFESYSDDLYISTLTAGKSIILRSGNATTALTLDSSQNATFAGSVRPEAAPSSKWAIDFASGTGSGAYVTIANDGTYDVAVGSGMLFVWDDGGSGVSQIMCYYGQTAITWQDGTFYTVTADTANKVNVYYNAGTNKYRVQNKSGSSKNFYISTIRLRQGS